jgi:hypothetical protein
MTARITTGGKNMAGETFSDGIAAAQAGRRQEAARIFGEILRQEPDRVEAWL